MANLQQSKVAVYRLHTRCHHSSNKLFAYQHFLIVVVVVVVMIVVVGYIIVRSKA